MAGIIIMMFAIILLLATAVGWIYAEIEKEVTHINRLTILGLWTIIITIIVVSFLSI